MRVSLLLLLSSGCWVNQNDLDKRINEVEDFDQDGFKSTTYGGEDCDDNSADVHPNADEICGDDIDNDCTGEADGADAIDASTFYADPDGDGFGNPETTEEACEAPAGFVTDNTDCDDESAEVNPDAEEVCNDIDDNCDGNIDESTASDAATWYADTDGDGFGDAAIAEVSCEAPSSFVADDTDCDDADTDVNPAATELCSTVGIDDNCDGEADENTADDVPTWYADTDGDGFGDASSSEVTCTAPSNFVADDTDCDDAESTIHPGASEICDGQRNDCDGGSSIPTDETDDDTDGWVECEWDSSGWDGDGAITGGDDCDDTLLSVHPNAEESCDSVDSDCDGTTDDGDEVDQQIWYQDGDNDGYGGASVTTTACDQPAGYAATNDDCDDTNSSVNPGASEICDNGIDNDCNSLADDADPGVTDQSTWYADNDTDGFGALSLSTTACTAPTANHVLDATDCDDTDPTVSPNAPELCDGQDNDCNSTVPVEEQDVDNDGWVACTVDPGGWDYTAIYGGDDCDDHAYAVNPSATEICNGLDDNCAFGADEGLSTATYYEDADNDGYGNAAITIVDCTAPPQYVTDDNDCDDHDYAVNPSATEICNGLDDDCDGTVDDGVLASVYYQDADGDGYGNPSSTTNSCGATSGYTSDNTDCDDTDGSIYPGAWEVLEDGEDSNCDNNPDDLEWVAINTSNPSGLHGVRMTGSADTLYLAWAADTIDTASGAFTNALAVRTLDGFDPLSTNNQTTVWQNANYATEVFHPAFNVIADDTYLYWGHSTTFTDFSSASSSILVQALNLGALQITGNKWDHANAQAFPATDVHLYSFEQGGIEHLQVTSCSGRDGSQVLFGNTVDFRTQPGAGVVQVFDYTNIAIPSTTPPALPSAHDCIGYHSSFSTASTDYYPWLLLSDHNTGLATYYQMSAGQLYTDSASPGILYDVAWDAVDLDATYHNGYLSKAYSLDDGFASKLYLSLYQYPWSSSYWDYISGPTLEQVDVTSSSNAETLACAINEYGGAHLFYYGPFNNNTNGLAQYHPLSPTASISTWDECAITASESGMLTVALLSGDTLYLGAIELP